MLGLPDNVPWVAVDTETSGLHPDDHASIACVSLTWPDTSDTVNASLTTKAFPFNQGRTDVKRPGFQVDLFTEAAPDPNLPEEAWVELLQWLARQRLVFHGAKFDLTMFAHGTDHWPGADLTSAFYWDTMLANGELDPTEDKGLDVSTKRLGIATGKQGLDEVSAWLKKHKLPTRRYDLVPWEVIKEYVETDTELTALLYQHQRQRIGTSPDRERILGRLYREFQLTRALMAMEQRGIGYDHERSLEAADTLDARAEAIKKQLPFDPDKKVSVAGWFVDTLGLTPERTSEKKGDPVIDEEQLRSWIDQDVEWAQELDDYNRCKRAVSMWYRGYPEKQGSDGRLRTSFKQGHVKSGRMSVERIQLQAMPKKDKFADSEGEQRPIFDGIPGPRDLMVPKEGHAIWQLDLSQAELRVASKYSGCRRMLEQLASGEDIHTNTTIEVLRVDPSHPTWKEKRDIGKRLTFGGIFQIGGEKFQRTLKKLAGIDMPLPECEALVQRWRGMYPEFGRMYYKAMLMAERKGCVPLLPNTRYETLGWFGPRDWPNTAWNRVVQGSLAEAFKLLLIEVETQWPGYAILTVHDSVYLECPIDEGARIAQEVADWVGPFMTDLFKIEMSMDVDQPKTLVTA